MERLELLAAEHIQDCARGAGGATEISDRCGVVIDTTDAPKLGSHPGFAGSEAFGAAAQTAEEMEVSDLGLYAATSWFGASW